MINENKWKFNEKYFDCMYYSIQNARQFLDDANILMKKHSYGHAASLAVLGQEECVKTIRYLIALLEGEEVEKGDPFHRDHRVKHMFSLVFRYAFSSPLLRYLEESLDVYIKGISKEKKKELKKRIKQFTKKLKGIKAKDYTPELLGEFIQIVSDVLDLPGFFIQFYKEISEDTEKMDEIKKYSEDIKKEFDLIYYKRQLDKIKMRGFYLECNREGVSFPHRLSIQEAQVQIENLEEVLENTTEAFGELEPGKLNLEDKLQIVEVLRYFINKIKQDLSNNQSTDLRPDSNSPC